MLVQEGADPQTSGRFYVAVVKYVLLFRSETWVVTPFIIMEMGSIHDQAARHISRSMPQHLQNIGCEQLPIGGALVDAGLMTIGIYVTHRRNTMAKYIATWPIFNIVME